MFPAGLGRHPDGLVEDTGRRMFFGDDAQNTGFK
jgi:hypothetical protein